MYYGNNEWSEKGPAQCDGRIGFGNSVPDILLVLRVLRFDIGIIAVVLAGGQRKLYLQSPDEYTESSFKNVNAGRVCGIISICIAGVVVVVLLLVLMGIVAGIGIASFGL